MWILELRNPYGWYRYQNLHFLKFVLMSKTGMFLMVAFSASLQYPTAMRGAGMVLHMGSLPASNSSRMSVYVMTASSSR